MILENGSLGGKAPQGEVWSPSILPGGRVLFIGGPGGRFRQEEEEKTASPVEEKKVQSSTLPPRTVMPNSVHD
jgi:hypothetical protein